MIISLTGKNTRQMPYKKIQSQKMTGFFYGRKYTKKLRRIKKEIRVN